MLLFFRNETGFGGNNGFTNFAHPRLRHHRAGHAGGAVRATVLLLVASLSSAGAWPGASSGAC
jgi:hypothetical protein